ncbi:MAG: hypothetical protein Q9218_006413 [Villophora microphyllina]
MSHRFYCDSNRDDENRHKKRRSASDHGRDSSKRSCHDYIFDDLRSSSDPVERVNSRNDMSFLARIEKQQRDEYGNKVALDYNALTCYLEEQQPRSEPRNQVQRQQHQHQHWRTPQADPLFAGIGCWADENATEKESK